jgi:hypothetical protein
MSTKVHRETIGRGYADEMPEEAARLEPGECPGPMDPFRAYVDRRGFLRLGVGGFLSFLMAQWLDPTPADAAGKPAAKACILLWMNGGPSHLDRNREQPREAPSKPLTRLRKACAFANTYRGLPKRPGIWPSFGA